MSWSRRRALLKMPHDAFGIIGVSLAGLAIS